MRCSVSNSFLEYSKNTIVRSKAGWYRWPQTSVGLCLACQLSASCKSGGLQRPAFPTWYIAAASERRMYICTASASSSTQFFNRTQMRIKLSCEMSTMESESRDMPWAGVSKERLGSRKRSITWITSFSGTAAIAAISPSCVGRRIPKFSPLFSVMALNKDSQICFWSSSSSS